MHYIKQEKSSTVQSCFKNSDSILKSWFIQIFLFDLLKKAKDRNEENNFSALATRNNEVDKIGQNRITTFKLVKEMQTQAWHSNSWKVPEC